MSTAVDLRHGLLLNTQDPPAGAAIPQRWQELLVLAGVAEEAGFESVHLPEHHGRDDGFLPQPLVACAALAARTSRILIGTGISVAPLRHPIHLAEEAAVVDVLSNGRLVLALGIGDHRPEYELFGLDIATQARRFDECLTVLLRGLTGERFSFEGRYYRFRDAAIRPVPVQRPRPDVWVGAMSRAGARRAARFGLPLYLDPLTTVTELEPLAAEYRAECARHGHAGRIVLSRWGWVDEDGRVDKWWPHVRLALWAYLVEIPRMAAPEAATSADDLDLASVAPDRLLVGTPGEVARTARDFAERLGADRLVVKLQGASGPWGASLEQAIRLYGRSVISAGGRTVRPTSSTR
ncbi:LLM class flavin-dependent oxidoreductase [Actinomadura sp. KC345]|uniref:LLM class flavin-dependent oxidoreductase n=1 Tax=Actinomadura sp. KC345 TaxID=2530371 RepID=UPI0014052DB6|nr:LLM class flavin-dependent oxidoreductase [Actinomadura sp. KC345]